MYLLIPLLWAVIVLFLTGKEERRRSLQMRLNPPPVKEGWFAPKEKTNDRC